MTEFENITLTEKNHYSATKWGLLVMLYSLLISIYLRSNLDHYSNPFNVVDNFELSILGIAYLSTWIVRIIVTIWIVKISKKINRNSFLWGVFGFITPPISLIIIGFLDFKISNAEIKKLVAKIRLDYKAELIYIKNTLDVSPEELGIIINDIENKYNKELQNGISFLVLDDERKENNDITIENDILIHDEQIDDNSGEMIESTEINLTTCPACGADIDMKMDTCSDCGISLK